MTLQSVMTLFTTELLILNEQSGTVYFKGYAEDIPLYLMDKHISSIGVYNNIIHVYIEM